MSSWDSDVAQAAVDEALGAPSSALDVEGAVNDAVNAHAAPRPSLRTGDRAPNEGRRSNGGGNGPLGALFVGVGRGVFGSLGALRRSSKTMIRLDLRKPRVWDLSKVGNADGTNAHGVSSQTAAEEARSGQRLKLMRQWDVGAPGGGEASFAAGINYSIDDGAFEPRVRLHTPLVNVRLLPRPELAFRRMLSIGGSGLAVDARYDLPLSEVGWRDARLRLRLVATGGRGIHVTQDGLEFDERMLSLGETTAAGVKSASTMRLSATAQLPREWPVKDEQPLVRLSLNKLALRVVIDA